MQEALNSLPSAAPAGAANSSSPNDSYQIIRRSGDVVAFAPQKIAVALTKAFLAVNGGQGAASARVRSSFPASPKPRPDAACCAVWPAAGIHPPSAASRAAAKATAANSWPDSTPCASSFATPRTILHPARSG